MLGVGRGGPRGGDGAAVAAADGRAASDSTAAKRVPASARGGRQDDGPPAAGRAVKPAFDERDAWVVLAAVDGIGPVSFGALVRAAGSARGVLDAATRRAGVAHLAAAAAAEGVRLAPDTASSLVAAIRAAPELLGRLERLRVRAVTAEDPAYPARLRAIELPPPVLFVRGDMRALAAERVVAVVGTRRPTDDGRRAASRIAAALAACGATVVSGLAVGIDGSAHAGALLAGGPTVAVLGSGHARLYPAAHADLADEIERSGGAVVTELPPDAGPRPSGFPRRNRIIAGLADATVVVEAGERSGALITAGWAMEQGRPVFACPGPIDRLQAVGCNRLLRAHPGEVRIVAGSDELVEDLGFAVPLPARRRPHARNAMPGPEPGAVFARLGTAEAAVVRRLAEGSTTADVLSQAADLQGATVLAVLTRLEEEGLVAAAFGRYRLAGALEGVRMPSRAGHRGAGGAPAGARDP